MNGDCDMQMSAIEKKNMASSTFAATSLQPHFH